VRVVLGSLQTTKNIVEYICMDQLGDTVNGRLLRRRNTLIMLCTLSWASKCGEK